MNGRLVSGPNGNTMFLPAAGCRSGSSLNNAGSNGDYWSRTLTPAPYLAYRVYFYSEDVGRNGRSRSYGFTVRAVRVSLN